MRIRLLAVGLLAGACALLGSNTGNALVTAPSDGWCKVSITSSVKPEKDGKYEVNVWVNAQGNSQKNYTTFCDYWSWDEEDWVTIRTWPGNQICEVMAAPHSGNEQVYLFECFITNNSVTGISLGEGYPLLVRAQIYSGGVKQDEHQMYLDSPVNQ